MTMHVHGVGARFYPNHEGGAMIKYEYTMAHIVFFHDSRHALCFPTKGTGIAFGMKEVIAVSTV